MKIPEWQYPFWNKWNKDFYNTIQKAAKSSYPKIIGNKKERNQFLKTLISTQKMKDYRAFFKILILELKEKNFNIPEILNKSKDLEIPEGFPNWAIWQVDKKICEYIDEVRDSKIDFIGEEKEFFEFVLRFSLSQLLAFWQGPLLHLLVNIKNAKKVSLKKLNRELSIWDYTKIFLEK